MEISFTLKLWNTQLQLYEQRLADHSLLSVSPHISLPLSLQPQPHLLHNQDTRKKRVGGCDGGEGGINVCYGGAKRVKGGREKLWETSNYFCCCHRKRWQKKKHNSDKSQDNINDKFISICNTSQENSKQQIKSKNHFLVLGVDFAVVDGIYSKDWLEVPIVS